MAMFRKLKAEEIECRAAMINQNGLSLLLYKDARCDQNILDETVGPMNWQRHHSRDNANCTVSLWDKEKNQWIEKEDTGTESNTQAEKGLASDSFKRACFNWGIGRELYTSPFIWISSGNCEIKQGPKGKLVCYDKFSVASIGYDESGKINDLMIKNTRTGKVVYLLNSGKKNSEDDQNKPDREELRAEVLRLAQSMGMTPAQVAQQYKLNANSTEKQLADVLEALKQNGGM